LDRDKLKSEYNHMSQFRFNHMDIKAFGILGVSVGLKWQKIQEKFKFLVKKFHPDINAGNKKHEEKLKQITLAYTQLKKTYREKIDT
jgi:curved DNA-binding protein CbpA